MSIDIDAASAGGADPPSSLAQDHRVKSRTYNAAPPTRHANATSLIARTLRRLLASMHARSHSSYRGHRHIRKERAVEHVLARAHARKREEFLHAGLQRAQHVLPARTRTMVWLWWVAHVRFARRRVLATRVQHALRACSSHALVGVLLAVADRRGGLCGSVVAASPFIGARLRQRVRARQPARVERGLRAAFRLAWKKQRILAI